MHIEENRLGFIGFGHMAQSIFQALEKAKLIPHSQILFHRRDPAKAKANEQKFSITSTSLANLVERSNIILLCVRPNQAPLVMQELRKTKFHSKMVISILAGVKISALHTHGNQIVRVMPNIASAVGLGMSLIAFGPDSSLEFRSTVQVLFSALGKTAEIDESQMDLGTGMSGSGPAFVIELIDAMAKVGVEGGLSPEKALTIAAQTFLGAAALILNGSSPSNLLNQITVEGGTTIAGLNVLHEQAVCSRFQRVILAAAARSKELSE